MHTLSPDGISLGHIEISQTDRLCLVAVRVRDYTKTLSETEESFANRVSSVRRKQFSSGRYAVRLALNTLNITEVPVFFDDRKPSWPDSIVGSITHSHSLAVVLIGFKQDFRGVGIDILPKCAVSDKVKDRVLLDSERKLTKEAGTEDLQTVFFCAKESIYKACNPETEEFLGFKDVRVHLSQCGTEYTADTTSPKVASNLVVSGRGYVFEVASYWLTIFLIR